VVCRDVWKSYGHREVLRGIDLSVNRGEVVTIMGPSGSGKSTLLRLITHLETLDRGEITVDGRHVGYTRIDGVLRPLRNVAPERAKARIGMVFQQFNLFEHLTALENICEAPVRVHGEPIEVARGRGRGAAGDPGTPTRAAHAPVPEPRRARPGIDAAPRAGAQRRRDRAAERTRAPGAARSGGRHRGARERGAGGGARAVAPLVHRG